MPLPTFIIVGAQKSGTTTLHDMLGQLPDAWMSDPKELHYFDQRHDRGLDWYSAQFHPGEEHRAWGESTPFYLYNDRARNTMVRSLPESRFVAVLREPVSRAYSHYWFARSKGREPLESFAEAVAKEPERLRARKDGQPAAFSYLDRGHYLRQLTALERQVGRDRMFVLLTDDLGHDPREALRRVCRFVGLDERGADTIEVRTRNTFSERMVNSADGLGKARVQQQHVGTSDGYPPIDPELERQLREQFRGENEELGNWLGRDLTTWLPG